MKRVLLATTAIAGLALVNPAAAQQAPMTVTLGGIVEFQAGFFSINDDDNADPASSGREFRMDPELVVNADAVADNGLKYGAEIELETGGGRGVRTDEVWMYVSGSFGQVRLGDVDGASDDLAVIGPTVGQLGQLDGDYTDWLGTFVAGLPLLYVPIDSGGGTSDSTKVTYYSPRFSGVQVGVSYTPEDGDEGDNVVAGDSTNSKDVIEGGVNYQGEFSGVGIRAGVNLAYTSELRTGDTSTAGGGVSQFGWQVGAKVSYAGFSIGGGYLDYDAEDQSGREGAEGDAWHVSAAYEFGPAGVAIGYGQATRDPADAANSGADIEEDVLSVGLSYTIAPGLNLSGDYYYVDDDNIGTANDRDAHLFVTSVSVRF